ncbi:MAG: hypothetical protein MRY78_17315 [Saprospiraceae bacterium]|nr:hypothetical protein [Saprospiraceae bacterium]
MNAETTTIQNLLADAKKNLSPSESASVLGLEQELAEAQTDSTKVESWKKLSGRWYGLGHPSISGHYAQLVAEKENSERSWSIAGTTFTICIQRAEEEKVKTFCTDRAVQAFESAISINPENTTNRVNLALAYAENPPKNNPMQGIQLLLELNRENPDDVLVLTTLARLGLRTGQFEKAVGRLEKALTIEQNNVAANCLIAQAYEQLGRAAEAASYAQKCDELRNQ